MKTTTSKQLSKSTLCKCLVPILAVGALVSCGPRSVAFTQSEPASAASTSATRIWHRAPAELPRGVADEAPTNGWQGIWGEAIEFRDAKDPVPLFEYRISL